MIIEGTVSWNKNWKRNGLTQHYCLFSVWWCRRNIWCPTEACPLIKLVLQKAT